MSASSLCAPKIGSGTAIIIGDRRRKHLTAGDRRSKNGSGHRIVVPAGKEVGSWLFVIILVIFVWFLYFHLGFSVFLSEHGGLNWRLPPPSVQTGGRRFHWFRREAVAAVRIQREAAAAVVLNGRSPPSLSCLRGHRRSCRGGQMGKRKRKKRGFIVLLAQPRSVVHAPGVDPVQASVAREGEPGAPLLAPARPAVATSGRPSNAVHAPGVDSAYETTLQR